MTPSDASEGLHDQRKCQTEDKKKTVTMKGDVETCHLSIERDV